MTGYSLVRVSRLSLDDFAARAGTHPELLRRWVALGLLEPTQDASGRLWFAATQLRSVARIHRLRAGLSVNYAALGLVMELLDRIEVLEEQLRATGAPLPDSGARGPSSVARCEE
ncbi:MAG TPA: chaperone modulator CbpM [Pseudonocardiaceae bacterium]|nr:chaperone modulator CbpM [Pseudonocardiaceae bacterium]